MSAIFNGVNAYLLASLAQPSYPMLLGGWQKVDASFETAASEIAGATNGDPVNRAGFFLDWRGDVANNPLQGWSYQSGAVNGNVTVDGGIVGTWQFGAVYYPSATSRTIYRDAASATQNTTVTPTGANTHAIGARYTNAASLFTNMRGAERFLCSGFSAANIGSIITQLVAGSRPINVPELNGSFAYYQPLKFGLGDAGSIGPAWTNNNVTFDAADHPVIFSNSSIYYYYHA